MPLGARGIALRQAKGLGLAHVSGDIAKAYSTALFGGLLPVPNRPS